MADTDTTTPQEGADTTQGDGDKPDPTTNGDGSPGGSQDTGTSTDPAIDKQVADLRKENASWRTKLRTTEAELAKLRDAAGTDQEAAVAAAREEARREVFAEALAEGNSRLLRGEVLAAAAGKLTDPADAVRMLDLEQFKVGDDGTVDRKAIAAAVDELVKTKPYLAGSRDPDFGARRPADTGTGDDMNALIRRKAGRS